MTNLLDRASKLLLELCELPPEAQAKRLAEIGLESPALRARVEALVEADRAPDPRLERHALAVLGLPAERSQGAEVSTWIARLRERKHVPDRYRMDGELGQGGMGTIYAVWDEDLKRRLAMKRMSVEGTNSTLDPRLVARFLNEARITGQLAHPGIVPVHELGVDESGNPYFTMKLVEGRTLGEVLELVRKREEGWSEPRALEVILRVCQAMAYAHSKGVIHRDLKPANVMVGRFGEVYVMDWGIAKIIDKAESNDLRPWLESPGPGGLTAKGQVLGTPHYMPPEQARGSTAELASYSDVYSVGAMLYELLSGVPPYGRPDGEAISAEEVRAEISKGPPRSIASFGTRAPAELIAICEKAMARDAAARFPAMGPFADDLSAYLERRVVRAYRTGPIAELRSWIARNKGTAVALAGILVISASALAFLSAQSARLDKRENTIQGLVPQLLNIVVSTNSSSELPYEVRVQMAIEQLREYSASALRLVVLFQAFGIRLDGEVPAEKIAAAIGDENPVTRELLIRGLYDLAQQIGLAGLAQASYYLQHGNAPNPEWELMARNHPRLVRIWPGLLAILEELPDQEIGAKALRGYEAWLMTRQAFEMPPHWSELSCVAELDFLSFFAVSAGDWQSAIPILDEGIGRQPDHFWFNIRRSRGAAIAGDLPMAMQFAEKALALQPESSIPHNLLAVLLELLEDHSGALEHYRRAHELRPDSPIDIFDLAQALVDDFERDSNGKSANLEEARGLLQRYCVMFPSDLRGPYQLAVVHRLLGDDATAVRVLDDALDVPSLTPTFEACVGKLKESPVREKVVGFYEEVIAQIEDPNERALHENLLRSFRE